MKTVKTKKSNSSMHDIVTEMVPNKGKVQVKFSCKSSKSLKIDYVFHYRYMIWKWTVKKIIAIVQSVKMFRN